MKYKTKERMSVDEKIYFFVIIILRAVFYWMLMPYTKIGDSDEYISVSSKAIFGGELHSRRTPIYPVFLDGIKYLSKNILKDENWLILVVGIQIIISFIAVVVMYMLIKSLTNKKIAYIITFIYGTSPNIIGWDKIILTESLAISGTVFFVYLLKNYLDSPNVRTGIKINILLFVLIFLRPTFLVNYIITLLFWSIRFFMYLNERRILLKNIIGSAIVGITVLGYAMLICKQYGIFTLSTTKTAQDCITIVQQSLWGNVKLNSSKEIVVDIIERNDPENENGCMEAVGYILASKDWKAIKQFNSDAIENNWTGFAKHKFLTMFLLADIDLGDNTWYGTSIWTATKLYYEDEITLYSVKNTDIYRKFVNIWRKLNITIRFCHIYILIFAEIWFIVKNNKKKEMWIHLGLASFMLAICVTSILGTCAEWGRTAICVLPYTYISLGYLIDYVIKKIKVQENIVNY